jgi:glycosyltransferase involved in cell wall biosynthesis
MFIKGLRDAGVDVTVAAPIGSKVPSGVELIKTVRLPEEFDREDIALDRIAESMMKNYTMAATQSPWDVFHDFSHKHLLGLQGRQIPGVFMLWDPVYYKYPKSRYNIMCCSEWQRQRFEALYHQKALHGQFWVDTGFYRPMTDGGRTERFLFLGKLSPEKGPDLAIDYCKELGVPLDVVGGLLDKEALNNAYLESLNAKCDGDKIRLHFNVSEDEKLKFLQTAKAMIYPVRQEEAHCLAMIEAWVTGCPVICNDRGAMREIMYEKNFVVKDKDGFLKRMGLVDLYKADWVREQAIKDYSVEKVIPEWIKLYEQVKNGLRVS